MKQDDLNFEVDELDKLCYLYMDGELTTLEEKELEYVLLHTSLTSQAIEDVKSIIVLQTANQQITKSSIKRNWNWRLFSTVAASITVIIISGFVYFINKSESSLSNSNDYVYIAAYTHGQRLNRKEAIIATNIAIQKADSLMKLASLTERDYMMKANDIITVTSND